MVNRPTLRNKSCSSKIILKEQHWLHDGGDHIYFFYFTWSVSSPEYQTFSLVRLQELFTTIVCHVFLLLRTFVVL